MEGIFLDFLNRSITAGWLILAVILLRMLLKRMPKWISCLMWALVAFRLTCPFSLESVFSLIPSRETVPHNMSVSSEPVFDCGIRFVDNAVNQVIRKSAAPRPEASANPLQIWLFAASVIWIAGTAVLLSYALWAYIRLWLKLRTAVRLQEPVMLSEFVDTPFVFGLVRPRIYLPCHLPEELRVPVIAHEIAHLKRRDNLWKILGYMLLAAYWFHPLCWVGYILFCRDMELACDEKVIRNYDVHQKKLYSEALLACSMDKHMALICPLAFGEVGVKERIKSVLHYKKPAFWAIMAAVAACTAAAVCFLTDPVKNEEGSGRAALAGVERGADADGAAGVERESDAGGTAGDGTGVNGLGNNAETAKTDAAGGDNTGSGGADGTDGAETGRTNSGDEAEAARTDSGDEAEASRTDSGNNAEADGNEADSSKTEAGGNKAGSSRQDTAKAAAQAALREDLVRKWSEAFVNRDGNAIESLASRSLADEMLSGPDGQREFGVSSPWPRETARDILIVDIGEENAQILYYAWTSDPHASVWKEDISYQLQDGKYVVTAADLFYLDDISTSREFEAAYGHCLMNGSAMDYEANGAGESLNDNALLSSSMQYRNLFQPESAAVELLNLSDDSSAVKIERIYEESGSVNLEILFPKEENALAVPITMVQPYGTEGIWIPKDYTVDVMARFQRMDWNEIRSIHLSDSNDPGIWRDVLCIAEIPDEGIKLYGYNDAEWSGQGVAIEMGEDVNYFDWVYTSTRCLLPECYWDREKRQLQVALNSYAGTGVAAQALHVLQHYDTGTLSDNAFEINDYQDILEERIHFRFEPETGLLTLFDTSSQNELASVTVEEGTVTDLELGNISRFLLGEKILLQLDPGYCVEGGAIAEYPEDMPQLEAEVLMEDRNGEIAFSLGEIRAVN